MTYQICWSKPRRWCTGWQHQSVSTHACRWYSNGGGGDTGVPISHIPDLLPPNIPYPRFFTPNIPYPRFFTPQYPISQISQSIDHIPDFARLECVCIHSFDIQLVRMDPILLDIFIIAVNVHGHLELHFNNVFLWLNNHWPKASARRSRRRSGVVWRSPVMPNLWKVIQSAIQSTICQNNTFILDIGYIINIYCSCLTVLQLHIKSGSRHIVYCRANT